MSWWDDAYRSGEFKKHWDYRQPSQELVGVVALLGTAPGQRALDIGCGAGNEAIFLAQCGFAVTGVDLSAQALKIARARAAECKVSVVFKRGNALKLPIGARSVHFINDRGCFHHIPAKDRPQYVHEVARVLVPGGRLLLRGFRGEGHDPNSFVPLDAEVLDALFDRSRFSRGPVLALELVSGARGRLPANLVVLRRRRKA